MRQGTWAVFVVALGMMAATAGCLMEIRKLHTLGQPGVKVGPVAMYGSDGKVVATQGVVLPETVLDVSSHPMPITVDELTGLPSDTTFGRRWYGSSAYGIENTVVLMGTDHASIHQPQYCLYAQGWNVTNTERISLRMARPFAYDIPAVKLVGTKQFKTGTGTFTLDCVYVYWFVSGDKTDKNKITAEEGSRLWSGWMKMLQKGEIERWAYISYFTTCLPGQESDTFKHLENMIRASVPEFQLVTGEPVERLAPSEARN